MLKYAIAALALAYVPSVAMAQSVSGDIGIHNRYIDEDLFVYTDKPVVQASLSLDVSERCSINAWGSHGISTKAGAELDLGTSCSFSLDEKTSVKVAANRFFLHDSDDMTEVSVGITHGPVDVTVSRYLWDNNPDATRIITSYSIEAGDKLTLGPLVMYETGFGEPDILTGGLSAEYKLTNRLSLVGLAVVPIKKNEWDERSAQASIGLTFNF
jgi:hypothetical protein